MKFKMLLVIMLLSVASTVSAMTVEQFVKEVKQRQAGIHTFQALMETNINSAMLGKTMKQTARYYKKGELVRVDMLSPVKQSTIYSTGNVITIGPDGRRTILPKNAGSADFAAKDPMDYFDKNDMMIDETGPDLVFSGTPKTGTPGSAGIGSIVFTVAKDDLTVTRLVIKRKNGSDMMISTMLYTKFDDLPVLKSIDSQVDMNGQKMFISVIYSAIKINKKIADSLFE